MKYEFLVKALRDCHIRGKWSDKDGNEIADKWIDLKAGELRDDIELVMALDSSFTDFPDDYIHMLDTGLLTVNHSMKIGLKETSFGVIEVTRLS